jgi:hypothetical protein
MSHIRSNTNSSKFSKQSAKKVENNFSSKRNIFNLTKETISINTNHTFNDKNMINTFSHSTEQTPISTINKSD